MGRSWIFLLAYTCSGLAGLVYEVAWTKLFALHLGHTTAAASTVVAVFVGGLGFGSIVGGRWASRLTPRKALYAYAFLELTVAVAAMAIVSSLPAVAPVLRWAYADGASTILFPIVRLVVCTALLLVPALALGATFPLATRWLAAPPSPSRGVAGRLYAANTAGAALGSIGAGFVLIPAIGLVGTTMIGVVGSGVSLLIAAWLAWSGRGSTPAEAPQLQHAPSPSGRSGGRRARRADRRDADLLEPDDRRFRVAAIVLMLTGFATFLYEIAWMRIFAVSFGPSTYALGATLSSFITGLAGGSFVGAALAGRMRRPAFGLVLALIGAVLAAALASVLAGGPLVLRLIDTFARSQQFRDVVLPMLFGVFGLTMPVAVALGVAFPLALEMAGLRGALASRRVGTLYAANTLGAVAGTFVAGFVAIPAVGLQGTLLCATTSLLLAVGVVVAWGISTQPRPFAGWLPVATGVPLLLLSPQWDHELLASGAYLYASSLPADADREAILRAGTLLYYREGAPATVSVREVAGERGLAVDGKVDASTSGVDMLTQKTLAHLPLLLHATPRAVALVGLGSGVTLASVLVHPVSAVDVIEISPEVIEASEYFADENRGALRDPRTNLIVGDARSHFSLSSRRYDVVISEPSNPWIAGVAALFTREFFLSVRGRLASGGIFCQWAHTYDISEQNLRSVAATFHSVFPEGSMWLVGNGDLLLVGSNAPLEDRLAGLSAAWSRAGVADDLRAVSITEPFSLLSMYVGGSPELREYSEGAPLHIDDTMALEFTGPFALYGDNAPRGPAMLRQLSGRRLPPPITHALETAGADQWRRRASMMLQVRAYDVAYDDYVRALRIVPTDVAALDGFVRAAAASRRQRDAVKLLEEWMTAQPAAGSLPVALSRLHAATGSWNEAIASALQARRLDPDNPVALEQLASLYSDLGDAGRLEPLADELRKMYPMRVDAWYYAANAKFLRQELSEAERLIRRAIQLDPTAAPARNLLGAIRASAGDLEVARASFEASLRLDPRDLVTYTNLAQLELQLGRRSAAARLFAEALSLDPMSDSARQGLAESRSAR